MKRLWGRCRLTVARMLSSGWCMSSLRRRPANWKYLMTGRISPWMTTLFFCGQRPLPFGGSHLRLPSGPAGIRTTTGSLSALARPTPYQLSHRVASPWMTTLGLRPRLDRSCLTTTEISSTRYKQAMISASILSEQCGRATDRHATTTCFSLVTS